VILLIVRILAKSYVADHRRDLLFRGFADAVKSGLNHFDPAKSEAARKIEIVLDNYGNIAAKALDRETAAIDDLLRELRNGDYPTFVGSLALDDWLTQLDAENKSFKALMMARYGEISQRSLSSMKVARKNTDASFRNVIDQVEALATVNGIAQYESFIRELNAVIERYKNIMASEAGRRKKGSKTEDKNETKSEDSLQINIDPVPAAIAAAGAGAGQQKRFCFHLCARRFGVSARLRQ
jgi:hypothetical protein